MPPAELVPTNEAALRLGTFLLVLLAVAGAQARWPRRPPALGARPRWPGNLGVAAVNAVVPRLALPAGLTGLAAAIAQRGWGLLPRIGAPPWLETCAAIALLDATVYAQHRLFHAVPALWRFHAAHHADVEIDVTTGVRFHPVEIALSTWIKAVAIVLLGPPVIAVPLFEVLLNATALFNHGNVRIPKRVDRLLRLVVVTPDMHRVHHSTEPDEMHRNFGFNLPWWDRIFGTYRAQPRRGHLGMEIGLAGVRDARATAGLAAVLAFPFRRRTC